MTDAIKITIDVSRPLGCPHGECEVKMSTDTFSSVGHGFPSRMGVREAIDRIVVDLTDAITDELAVGYLWDEAHLAETEVDKPQRGGDGPW